MLVQCRDCNAVINNECLECPWCFAERHPLETDRPRWQISLLELLLIVSILGLWLGFTLRDSLR